MFGALQLPRRRVSTRPSYELRVIFSGRRYAKCSLSCLQSAGALEVAGEGAMGKRAVIGATLAVPWGSCHTDRVRARRTRWAREACARDRSRC